MNDARSGKIVVVSHCLLNVHSLEDDLAVYSGLEEKLFGLLMTSSVGIIQIPYPEMWLSGIFRKPLLKKAYNQPVIRKKYRRLATEISGQIRQFTREGYRITAILGAEGSPTYKIDRVGSWKDPQKKGKFPEDIDFVLGRGVFMEELSSELENYEITVPWIGIPGKSIREGNREAFAETFAELKKIFQ